MSVEVMGNGSLKRPWDDEDPHDFERRQTDTLPTSAFARTFSADSYPQGEQRLPSLAATLGRSEEQQRLLTIQSERDSTYAHRASPMSCSLASPKRPRLLINEFGKVGRAPITEPLRHDASDFGISTPDRSAIQSARNKNDYVVAPVGIPHSESACCTKCSNTEDLVQNVVSGLLGLQTDIRQALVKARHTEAANEDTEGEALKVSELDLRSSLMWACSSIQKSTTLLKEATRSRPPILGLSLPPIQVANTTSQPDLPPTPAEAPGHPSDAHDRERNDDQTPRYTSSSQGPQISRLTDTIIPPSTMYPDPSRKGNSSDQAQTRPVQSPRRSNSGSTYGSGQSPLQMQGSSRTLPSPASMNYPPSGLGLPVAYSPSLNQSVHNAHLQDLQHQISTKTLALQTLQREHDQLLAAFSRSQIRCSTLDKKSQVSDHEINSLAEEKIRLQSQVETLEGQVEDLVKVKDEAHAQTSANSAQWRQIVAMSSQLQVKSAEELKRYRADREAWERDRDGLQQRISELESGKLTLVDSGHTANSGISIPPTDILASSSLDVLRAEVVRLRARCADMEVALQDLGRVTEQMDTMMGDFADIRQRITLQTRHGLHATEVPEGQHRDDATSGLPSEFAD